MINGDRLPLQLDDLEDELGIRATYTTETYVYYRDRDETDAVEVVVSFASTTLGGPLTSSDHDTTGIMIWPASHLLCQAMVSNPCLNAALEGKSVVELGCGVGLVGVTAATHAKVQLWVNTDVDERSLRLCQSNHQINDMDTDSSSCRSWVRSLAWGDDERASDLLDELRQRTTPSYHDDDDDECRCRFDAVVAADVVYPSTSGRVLNDLFATVDGLLRMNGTFWLSFASRDGIKTPVRLLEAASLAGFAVEKLEHPVDESLLHRLPPLLDSKILMFRRDACAETRNQRVGGDDCPIFPGLKATLKRRDEESSDEEWIAPFEDEEDEDEDDKSGR